MINKYKLFLESNGVSEIIKENYKKILDIFLNLGFGIYNFSIECKNLNISGTIIFKPALDYSSNISFVGTTLLSDKIKNIKLSFNLPIKYNKNKFISVIFHELTHALEFYNLIIKNIKNTNRTSLKLISSKINKDEFETFKHFIYLSLDNELNARIAETYCQLMELKSNNYDIIKQALLKSENWLKKEVLLNFNYVKLLNELKEKFNIEDVISIFNMFNTEIKPLKLIKFDKIISEEDLLNYFKKWNVYFSNKAKKHEEKFINLIDEVMLDYGKNIFENYTS